MKNEEKLEKELRKFIEDLVKIRAINRLLFNNFNYEE